MRYHYIKCEREYFEAVDRGEKCFELRINDRDYRVGDRLILLEAVEKKETGRKLEPIEIIYILHGGQHGLEEGYCILSF